MLMAVEMWWVFFVVVIVFKLIMLLGLALCFKARFDKVSQSKNARVDIYSTAAFLLLTSG